MTHAQLIARAGAAVGYQLVNNGDGRFANITLGRDCWNPLIVQADAEQLAVDMEMNAADLDTPQGRRDLVEAAVHCCVKGN